MVQTFSFVCTIRINKLSTRCHFISQYISSFFLCCRLNLLLNLLSYNLLLKLQLPQQVIMPNSEVCEDIIPCHSVYSKVRWNLTHQMLLHRIYTLIKNIRIYFGTNRDEFPRALWTVELFFLADDMSVISDLVYVLLFFSILAIAITCSLMDWRYGLDGGWTSNNREAYMSTE